MEILNTYYEIMDILLGFPGFIITWLTIFGVCIAIGYIKIQLKEKKSLKEKQKRKDELDKYN